LDVFDGKDDDDDIGMVLLLLLLLAATMGVQDDKSRAIPKSNKTRL